MRKKLPWTLRRRALLLSVLPMHPMSRKLIMWDWSLRKFSSKSRRYVIHAAAFYIIWSIFSYLNSFRNAIKYADKPEVINQQSRRQSHLCLSCLHQF